MTIIDKIRADLAFRLPNSGRPLGHIVLKRREAEQLLIELSAPDPQDDPTRDRKNDAGGDAGADQH